MKEEEQKEEEAAAKLAFSSALVSRWGARTPQR